MLAGDDGRAGDAAVEDPGEPVPVAVGEGAEQGVHVVADRPQQHGERVGVGGEDLLPERGVAGRDPGDVAHALPGQREVLARRVGEPPGGQGGQQVRQVGRAGDGLVVLLGGERDRRGAAGPASAVTSATAPGSACSCGVTAHGRPSKSDSLAANGPDRSLPAIGWLPT